MSAKRINTLNLKLENTTTLKHEVWKATGVNEGNDVVVSFQQLGPLDLQGILSDTERLYERFVTGVKELRKVNGEERWYQHPPEPIPPLDGQVVTVTKGTCQVVAILMQAQHTTDPRWRFSPTEWFHILLIKEFQEKAIAVIGEFIMSNVNLGAEWTDEEGEGSNPLADSDANESDSLTTPVSN